MFAFDAAQPALLYLVPACLGMAAVVGVCRGEFAELAAYSEEEAPASSNGAASPRTRSCEVAEARRVAEAGQVAEACAVAAALVARVRACRARRLVPSASADARARFQCYSGRSFGGADESRARRRRVESASTRGPVVRVRVRVEEVVDEVRNPVRAEAERARRQDHHLFWTIVRPCRDCDSSKAFSKAATPCVSILVGASPLLGLLVYFLLLLQFMLQLRPLSM